MEKNDKINRLSHIIVSFSMLLFAMFLTMHVLLCCTYAPYGSLDMTTVIETWATSESMAENEDIDHTTDFKTSFLNQNNSYNETITKNICSILTMAAIPKGISFTFFLFYFLTLSISLPDDHTLINQKVRLDN